MKNHINITLDNEIIEQLRRENNYSELINEQMKGYYAVQTCENLQILTENLKKTKQILKEYRRKRREIEAQVFKINKKRKLFKKNMLSRSKMIEEERRRRKEESSNPHINVEYYISCEEEVDRKLNRLKGGSKK